MVDRKRRIKVVISCEAYNSISIMRAVIIPLMLMLSHDITSFILHLLYDLPVQCIFVLPSKDYDSQFVTNDC